MDYGYIKKRARELRKDQTPAEAKLLDFLRNRKFHGLKFLRQHPIEYEATGNRLFFIAHFYCARRRLVLELDGKVHDFQQERDSERDKILRLLGFTVVRIKNEELLDMKAVALKIEMSLKFHSYPSLSAERGSEGK
jgi:leucyl-tRNA synthetase